jgi:hypothetical protein
VSCGLPDVPDLILPFPEVDVPEVPTLPLRPDFSWMKDLGIDLGDLIPEVELPFPEVDVPEVPGLPGVRQPPCPFDD